MCVEYFNHNNHIYTLLWKSTTPHSRNDEFNSMITLTLNNISNKYNKSILPWAIDKHKVLTILQAELLNYWTLRLCFNVAVPIGLIWWQSIVVGRSELCYQWQCFPGLQSAKISSELPTSLLSSGLLVNIKKENQQKMENTGK